MKNQRSLLTPYRTVAVTLALLRLCSTRCLASEMNSSTAEPIGIRVGWVQILPNKRPTCPQFPVDTRENFPWITPVSSVTVCTNVKVNRALYRNQFRAIASIIFHTTSVSLLVIDDIQRKNRVAVWKGGAHKRLQANLPINSALQALFPFTGIVTGATKDSLEVIIGRVVPEVGTQGVVVSELPLKDSFSPHRLNKGDIKGVFEIKAIEGKTVILRSLVTGERPDIKVGSIFLVPGS